MKANATGQFEKDSRRTFGKRKVAPRVCVFESKEHLRTFLAEALEELGLVVRGCASPEGLSEGIRTHYPDILIFGSSIEGMTAVRALELIAAEGFDGKILLLGPAKSPMLAGIHDLGSRLGLAMLPVLKTPFADSALRAALADLLPTEQPPAPAIDAEEALEAGWLELWYQPKVAVQRFSLDGAEALIRMRHPTWGVVPPAYFIPSAGDPGFRALSEFVIGTALKDWSYFVAQRGPIQLAINLPLAFFRNFGAAHDLCRMLPKHAAFDGLIVELDACEIMADPSFANELARALRLHNIGVSVDNVGEECGSLAAIEDFAFAEVKVDRAFVQGCADDTLRRLACRQIVEFAQASGAQAVACGVESRRDYFVLRELGVDQIQGFLLAKPMPAPKLARFALDSRF